MSQNFCRPYTIIKVETRPDGTTRDAPFLHYQGVEMPLTPTEYAVVVGLLNSKLDMSEIDSERESIKGFRHHMDECIGRESLKTYLSILRKKVSTHFSDLVIPGSKNMHTGELGLWTRQEIESLHQSLANPEGGFFEIRDELGRWHIFINGQEVKSKDGKCPSELERLIIKYAASPQGMTYRAFRKAGNNLTTNRESSVTVFTVRLHGIRKALAAVGMTLTKRQGVQWKEDPPVFLVPLRPQCNDPNLTAATPASPTSR